MGENIFAYLIGMHLGGIFHPIANPILSFFHPNSCGPGASLLRPVSLRSPTKHTVVYFSFTRLILSVDVSFLPPIEGLFYGAPCGGMGYNSFFNGQNCNYQIIFILGVVFFSGLRFPPQLVCRLHDFLDAARSSTPPQPPVQECGKKKFADRKEGIGCPLA
jgi:hypothetical protein